MRFALAWFSLGVSLFSLNGCFNVGDDDAAPAKDGQAGEDGTGGTKTSGGAGGSAGSGTGAKAGKGGGGGKPGFLPRGGSAGKSSAGKGATDTSGGTGGTAGGTGGTGGDAGDESGGTGGTTGGTGGSDNGGEGGTGGTTGGTAGGGTGGTGGGASGSGGTGGGMGGTGAIPGWPTSPTATCEEFSDKLEGCGVTDHAIDCQYASQGFEMPCYYGCFASGACGDVHDYTCNYYGAENAVKDCVLRCDQYECKNGVLNPISYFCDGTEDCSEGEDEANCFMCDGHKVREALMCDGVADCADESDEAGCPTGTPTFHCATGSEEYPGSYRCDAFDDCEDGSDELNCPVKSCNQGAIPVRGAACAVAAEHLNSCDLLPGGVMTSCTDGTARKACEKTCYATASCDVLEAALCGDGGDSLFDCMNACTSVTDFMPCDGGEVGIRSDWICDNEVDCEDGTDETNCDFVCLNGAGSITNNYVCNGVDNCGDDSDESGCQPTCP